MKQRNSLTYVFYWHGKNTCFGAMRNVMEDFDKGVCMIYIQAILHMHDE